MSSESHDELNDRRPDPHKKRNEKDKEPRPFEKLVHSSDGSDIPHLDKLVIESLSMVCSTMEICSINELVCTTAFEAFMNTLKEEYNKSGRVGHLPFMFLSKVCDCNEPFCYGTITVLAFAGAEGRKYADKLSVATQELLKSTGGRFEKEDE